MFTVNQNKGFSLDLPNGWTVSVQFGGGNYCDHHQSRYDVSYLGGRGGSTWESKTAEIAAFPTNDSEAKWYSFGREEEGMQTYVEGYQKVEEVLDFINTIRAFPNQGASDILRSVYDQVGEEGKDDGKELSLAAARSLADAAWAESH